MALVLDAAEDGAVDQAVEVVTGGGLIVAPVGGVYALIGDAFVGQVTALLRALRGAAVDLPLTLLVRSHKQLPGLASQVPEAAEELVAGFWPGPLTLLLPVAESIAVDLGASDGTVAVRQPADEATLAVVGGVGPLACSSAAPVGEPLPATVAEAVDAFGESVGAYLDAGELDGARSTVVDCSRGGAEVRRRGAISADEVLDAVSGLDGTGSGEPPAAPQAPAGPGGNADGPERID
jgi:tRNA threonylcarbamoyl adenosine modification protein (Sua5/YciO/YrdC/YwlC family)